MQKFFIIGGDRRQKYLERLLEAEGFFTYSFGLDSRQDKTAFLKHLRAEYEKTILLPLPVTRDGETIFMPLTQEKLTFSALLSVMHEGETCVGFGLPRDFVKAAEQKHIGMIDLLNERVLLENAKLTARAALQIAETSCRTPLSKAKVGIFGFGRVGEALTRLLLPKCAAVCVFARSDAALENAAALGAKTVHLQDMYAHLKNQDLLFNTVPARLLQEESLRQIPSETILIELASKPFCVDFELAEKSGKTVLKAGGLPGKYFPCAGAKILADAILKTF